MVSCRARKHCGQSTRSSPPLHAPIAAMSKRKPSSTHRAGAWSVAPHQTPASADEECRIPRGASSTDAHAPQGRQTTLRGKAGCCMDSCFRWKKPAAQRCEWIRASFRTQGGAPTIERQADATRSTAARCGVGSGQKITGDISGGRSHSIQSPAPA